MTTFQNSQNAILLCIYLSITSTSLQQPVLIVPKDGCCRQVALYIFVELIFVGIWYDHSVVYWIKADWIVYFKVLQNFSKN